MLPADVYARFLRQKGCEVLFICGTDEHGTPAEIAARDKPVEVYCAEMFETQKKLYEELDLSFDYFGRSSAPSNHELTVEIFEDLKRNGYITEKVIKQYYSHKDGRFLPDRYVRGTCPKCSSPKARGDQCEDCGVLLDPSDLIDPYSAISADKDLELRESTHYFLKLQDLEAKVEAWVNTQETWPKTTKGIAKKWLKEGLKERCITRDLKWGIKVPGCEDKVFYVWFDAPNAYMSMTKDFTDEWEKWWLEDHQDVVYTQFMAKDNVPFHAIFWPAVLMGTGKDWKMVDQLKSFNWLNYDGGKFSTSDQRGIFIDQALELYPTDYWRYYLMANIPESSDTDFTFGHFAQIINKDLADVLGNFINRVNTLVYKYYSGSLPFHALPKDLKIEEMIEDFKQGIEGLNFRHAMSVLNQLWHKGNEYIASKEPWKLVKESPQETEQVLSHTIYLTYIFAVLSYSIMPKTAKKIFDILNITHDFSFKSINSPPEVWSIKKSEPLFQKISDEEVIKYSQKFSGSSCEL